MARDERGEPHLVFRDVAEEDDLDRVVRQIQALLLAYPLAAQAMFRALVAEGRAFAATAEGRRWAERLVHSPLVRRGRLLWDVATVRALDDDPDVLLPSALAEAFVKLTAKEVLEPLLSRFFEDELDDDDR
ncbi:MAG: hypothetical protein AB1689_02980 [Thermodesulfobacteriota bacterium]